MRFFRRYGLIWAVLAVLAVGKLPGAIAQQVMGQTVTPIGGALKFVGDDTTSFDRFGESVAIDGDTVLVGALGAENTQGRSNAGAAYVFVKEGDGWVQQQRLVPSDDATVIGYGLAVALDSDTAVITASSDGIIGDFGRTFGAAYVFTRNGDTWTQQDKLPYPGEMTLSEFGMSVALDEDTIFVGDPLQSEDAGRAGAVYVFTRTMDDWIFADRLSNPVPALGQRFGASVAIDGSTALVGASVEDGQFQDPGEVFVYTGGGGTWAQRTILAASDGIDENFFGISVALDGDTALIGAAGDDGSTPESGSAYVFVGSGNTWTEQAKLTASDGDSFDRFGRSVAIDGNVALVGAHQVGPSRSNDGAAYIYLRRGTNWTEFRRFTSPDNTAGDNFGYSVSLDFTTVFIGAVLDDAVGGASGSAYLFTSSQTPPVTVNPDVNGDGIVSASDAIFVINRIGDPPTGDDAPADADGDGDIDEADANAIINAIGQ